MNLNINTIETINPCLNVSKDKDPTLKRKQQKENTVIPKWRLERLVLKNTRKRYRSSHNLQFESNDSKSALASAITREGSKGANWGKDK